MLCKQSTVEEEGTGSQRGEMEENPVSQSSDVSGCHAAPSPTGHSQPQKQLLSHSWVPRTASEAGLLFSAISQTSQRGLTIRFHASGP